MKRQRFRADYQTNQRVARLKVANRPRHTDVIQYVIIRRSCEQNLQLRGTPSSAHGEKSGKAMLPRYINDVEQASGFSGLHAGAAY